MPTNRRRLDRGGDRQGDAQAPRVCGTRGASQAEVCPVPRRYSGRFTTGASPSSGVTHLIPEIPTPATADPAMLVTEELAD